MTSRAAINAAVKEAYDAGLCVIPPKEDGTKAPALDTWKEFQDHRPDLDLLRKLYQEERHGLGVIGGPVSGQLEAFECESEEIWRRFRMAMGDAGLDDLLGRAEEGYLERAPRGGVHYLWRTERAGGNRKLARNADRETLIEMKAAGGFMILSPSYGPVHPSGRPYERLSGEFSTIPFLAQEERDAWLMVAETFDLSPKMDGIPYWGTEINSDDLSLPGNDFNVRGRWHEDVLLPAGWTLVSSMADGVGKPQEFWRRPGKDRGNSAVLHPHAGHGGLFVCFSTSTPFETEEGYSKFRTYALLHHDGDFTAAARELKRRGYGQEKKLWTPPPIGGMRGSDVFDLDVPEIETMPLLGQKGMVMKGGSNLLYAYPKTGKTELVCQVVPEWVETGERVVYLTEEPLWFWKPRLRRHPRPREFWDSLVFVPAFGWGIKAVYEYVEQLDFDVLIVDTLRNTCGFQEGEGDKDVSRVVIPLIALTREKDATFFSLYHARKMPGEDGRDISGHHSLYGVFDRALQLRKISGEENETKRRLTLSGRLLTPETPAGMTYQMNAQGLFESLEVKHLAEWERMKKKGDGE